MASQAMCRTRPPSTVRRDFGFLYLSHLICGARACWGFKELVTKGVLMFAMMFIDINIFKFGSSLPEACKCWCFDTNALELKK